MKKLLLTVIGVTVVFVRFITILCLLPCNQNRWHYHREQCDPDSYREKDGDGKCSGDKDACEGKEHCTEKCWTAADGKMHKEVRVMIGDDKEMGNCPMENGKCGMD